MQHVRDLGFPKARGVVFQRKQLLRFVDAKAAQAIDVCEFAEAAKFFGSQRRLQFVGNLDECHVRIIAAAQTRRQEPGSRPCASSFLRVECTRFSAPETEIADGIGERREGSFIPEDAMAKKTTASDARLNLHIECVVHAVNFLP